MPSVSSKQHRFMEAVAHDPAFARKVGVPQSVGQDFATADAARGNGSAADPMKARKRTAQRIRKG